MKIYFLKEKDTLAHIATYTCNDDVTLPAEFLRHVSETGFVVVSPRPDYAKDVHDLREMIMEEIAEYCG